MSDQNSIDDIIKQAQSGGTESVKKEEGGSSPRITPNKIIDRLDDVTIQSETEAGKVIDLIDEIMNKLGNVDTCVSEIKGLINSSEIDKIKIGKLLNNIDSTNREVQDMLFNTMNLLQYQDVLRQKIEKIASALTTFYDYLGEFLGKGKKDITQRTAGKHVEDSTLDRDQKLDEINKLIKDMKKD